MIKHGLSMFIVSLRLQLCLDRGLLGGTESLSRRKEGCISGDPDHEAIVVNSHQLDTLERTPAILLLLCCYLLLALLKDCVCFCLPVWFSCCGRPKFECFFLGAQIVGSGATQRQKTVPCLLQLLHSN